MIPKANALIAAAVAAFGVTLTAGRPAVAETLLDQFTVSAVKIAGVNDAGNCIMIVDVNSGAAGAVETRVVADSKGSARLYTTLASTDSLTKNMNLGAGVAVSFIPFYVEESVSDPIAEAIKVHKAAVKEKATYLAEKVSQDASIAVAVATGWNTAPVGSIKRRTYESDVQRQLVVSEVVDFNTAQIAQYGAILTGANIDLVTYLPIPAVTP